MNSKLNEIIQLMLKSLKEKFDDFHGLYLHGRHKDGKMHKDDDIELVAIFDKEDKYKREIIWPIVGKIETDYDVFIDLNPISEDDFKKDEEFYHEVVDDGIWFKA